MFYTQYLGVLQLGYNKTSKKGATNRQVINR